MRLALTLAFLTLAFSGCIGSGEPPQQAAEPIETDDSAKDTGAFAGWSATLSYNAAEVDRTWTFDVPSDGGTIRFGMDNDDPRAYHVGDISVHIFGPDGDGRVLIEGSGAMKSGAGANSGTHSNGIGIAAEKGTYTVHFSAHGSGYVPLVATLES